MCVELGPLPIEHDYLILSLVHSPKDSNLHTLNFTFSWDFRYFEICGGLLAFYFNEYFKIRFNTKYFKNSNLTLTFKW